MNMFDSFMADSFTKSFLKLAEKERLKKRARNGEKEKIAPKELLF
ncbi:hypothetical protein [Lactobacillus delbrueckii]|nr:hypothetical protein [Lactobacillus delbrueckii]